MDRKSSSPSVSQNKAFSGQTASGNARQHVGDHYGSSYICVNTSPKTVYVYSLTVGPDNYQTSRGRASNADEQRRLNELLVEAAAKKYTHRLRSLIQAGADVDYVSKEGNSALYCAANVGSNEGVKILIEAGSDINFHNTDLGHTPLHIAAMRGNCDVVQTLLSTSGIEHDSRNENGDTPLHSAASIDASAIRLLVAHGCDVEATAGDLKKSPLADAAERGYKAAVMILVELGANINAISRSGKTPLDWAREGREYTYAFSPADRDCRGTMEYLKGQGAFENGPFENENSETEDSDA